MKFRSIIGFLFALMVCSCTQQTSKGKLLKENVDNDKLEFKSGLNIKNRTNRGTNYTDRQGTDYSIRNIPISITNDSTISIHLQIAFSLEYNYPHPESDEKFKLIPLPKEWALDGLGVTENMIDELANHIEKPFLHVTIKPHEEFLLSIGSLYPRPTKTNGVVPKILFVQNDATIFPDCDWLMQKNQLSNQQIPMGLKIVIGEKCMIIPCGSISYLND